MTLRFQGRLGLQQRVLPDYRAPFFDALADACKGGLEVFAGLPRPGEGIQPGRLDRAQWVLARNLHFFDGPLMLCYQRGFIRWLERWDPDALVVEANPRYLATSSAVKWMHARGRKVIGWGLGAPPISGPASALRRARRSRFLSQFDALIAYSRRGAQQYGSAGFPQARILVAPNSAARGPSHPPSGSPTHEQPTVLFVGRLQPRKRVDSLIRACAALPAPGPRLLVVGDGPEKSPLERLALEVYPEAQFAGDRRGEELEALFTQADVFVLPGTGGLAVQQAMAHGLPVIVAQGDGTQDDLVRAQNGWQIPPGDEIALRQALQRALSDMDRLRAMGRESYRIVSDEINLEKMVEAFVEALAIA